MRRSKLPYLSHRGKVLPRQREYGPVEPRDGRVRVLAHPTARPDGRYTASFFLVWTPGLHDGAGELVPCTPQACRRWVEAALAYATAVDRVTADLHAAHLRAAHLPWWRPLAGYLAMAAFEETSRRYERVLREAAGAYDPVGEEIRQLIRAEKEKEAERARELARKEEETRSRRARLAARPVWGWRVVTKEGGGRSVYVFRHDVPSPGMPPPAPGAAAGGPRVDLETLRSALRELNLPDVAWDAAALVATKREVGIGLGRWWRDMFHENYRTFTKPPPRPRPTRRGNPSGGTATGGTGGFTGGFGGGF